ncbi:MAG: YqgE/AlgH family protein [Gammaproteobacteria bacterium]|nr:YqgE/AlgH family protein [Gammaproteobacteria bacterium]
MTMASSLKNHFLIAMPSLNDTFFYHSVVYLCEHDDKGAMGLIINRPTQITVDELLTHINIDTSAAQNKHIPILFGGPVDKSQGMVLHDSKQYRDSSLQISDSLYLTTSTDILKQIGHGAGPENMLIALGYAGWDAGQLEQEISDNSWLTVKSDHSIIFNTPANERWQAAAALLGVDITLLSSIAGHA